MTNQRGFTLLELLMAVGIFALVSAMAYGGLNSVLKTSTHTRESSEQLQALQRGMALLDQDLRQIIERGIRNSYGESEGALVAIEGGDPLIRFTRTGWRNPIGRPRSTLQRVAYRLDESTLVREYWFTLDQAANAEPVRVPLLEDIEEVSFTFYEGNNEYRNWPPLSAGNEDPGLPDAVRITLGTAPWGDIDRLYRVNQAQ